MKFSALFSYMLWDIELKFCFNVLQIKFKCCLCASVWLSVSPSIFCTCLLYWAGNFNFNFGFFNAFLLEKSYIKIALYNVHDGRIMHRLWCSGIFHKAAYTSKARSSEVLRNTLLKTWVESDLDKNSNKLLEHLKSPNFNHMRSTLSKWQ